MTDATAGVHRGARGRGGVVGGGGGAAADNTCSRSSRQYDGRELCSSLGGVHAGAKGGRLHRKPEPPCRTRWANDEYDRLPEMAADLVRAQVSLIAAVGNNLPARAAKTATSTIPIVSQWVSTP